MKISIVVKLSVAVAMFAATMLVAGTLMQMIAGPVAVAENTTDPGRLEVGSPTGPGAIQQKSR